MKIGKQIVGLPLYGLAEGREIGTVKGFVCNPGEGKVDALLLDGEAYYLELRAILIDTVVGIGDFAVTVNNASLARRVTTQPTVYALLQHDVKVLGSRVLTREGKLIGTVTEIAIDEKTGVIAGCELTPANAEKAAGFIRRSDIITYGSQHLVVKEDCVFRLAAQPVELESEIQPVESPETNEGDIGGNATVETQEDFKQIADPAKLSGDRQRQFLVGRKLDKSLVANTGEVIGEAGDLITDEMIDQAIALDKYLELTMYNTK
ncbi:MAG: PRC-barrel domain-containing protein [Bacillota bacterium]